MIVGETATAAPCFADEYKCGWPSPTGGKAAVLQSSSSLTMFARVITHPKFKASLLTVADTT